MDPSCLLVLSFCSLVIQLQLKVTRLDEPQVCTFTAALVTGNLEAECLHVHTRAKSMARLKEEQKSLSVCQGQPSS